ncbi:cytochrome P450 2D6-like [Branchiostoma lanceolatum]|uniref:cytochrome P450 2D6-like n=1 Tax=Branchiostoma lanceolatum TaxID=7740 RepID=UPI003453B1FC
MRLQDQAKDAKPFGVKPVRIRPVGGVRVEVLMNLHYLHTDPAYWPDPDRFDPERFLDSEGNVINKPGSFMPFGGGRRVCLGEQLARMELFLFFSTLLQSFTFRTPEGAPPPNTDGVFGLILKPHPFQLCAMPR